MKESDREKVAGLLGSFKDPLETKDCFMCLNISFSQLYLATEMEGWTWPG
jgi:hypothetical protein